MRVGVVLEVLEVWFVLRDQPVKKSEHVRLHIRIRILIDRQTARRVLREQYTDPVGLIGNQLLNFRCDVDHLLAIA